jgi:anti-sigma regulatory factor (Ser/Thr protein kinase)
MPASLPLARQAVRQLVTALDLGKDKSFAAEVAVGEAVSNVVEHAYRGTPGTLNVRGMVEGDKVVFEVEDQGEWRARRDEGRGRGLQFMRMLSDAVEVKRTTQGTAVRLSLALNGAPSGSASGAQTDGEAV